MRIRMLIFFVGMFIAVSAHAQKGWFIKNAEIISVGVFHDGNNSVLQLRFKALPSDVDGTALSCAPTWVDGSTTSSDVMTTAWWSESNPNSRAQAQYSTALSAQAQDLPVDLYLDTSRCASSSAKPYGNLWQGIRLSE